MNKNSERLKYIMDNCGAGYSDKLLEIPFKCYFSKYLYLILKQRLSYLDWKANEGSYKLALPVEVNVGRLIKEYNVCRNIFRRAIKELISVGLIEKIDWFPASHSACFVVLVHNDALIESYNPDSHIVAYTKTLSFNFNDEELH
ncbi:MAG: hypothetical protein ACOYN6_00350 [Ignavibacteria bacterium]